MTERLRVRLLHLQVRPIWITVDEDGRPLSTVAGEPWLVHWHEIDALKARVAALEAEATAAAGGDDGERFSKGFEGSVEEAVGA